MRRFEKVARVKDINIQLPKRNTKYSAGYDFYCIEDIILKPHSTYLIKTGVKAYMNEDEFLMLSIRSSSSYKNNLTLSNSIGVIDHDYVDNADNEGEIGFLIRNNSDKPFTFYKSDKIGQGIFLKYLIVDDEISPDIVRSGGFGSTGK